MLTLRCFLNFLKENVGISVGHSQGAATANFLAGVSVGRLQGAAIANFLAAFLWVAYRAVFAIS